jgi:hypothetical protein
MGGGAATVLCAVAGDPRAKTAAGTTARAITKSDALWNLIQRRIPLAI